MGLMARRPRAVLRKFDPRHEYWYGAELIAEYSGGATLVTYWRNPELAGIWELRYEVTPACFRELQQQELIEQDQSKDPRTYTLSHKGKERLGIA